jgi:hypothetical protein
MRLVRACPPMEASLRTDTFEMVRNKEIKNGLLQLRDGRAAMKFCRECRQRIAKWEGPNVPPHRFEVGRRQMGAMCLFSKHSQLKRSLLVRSPPACRMRDHHNCSAIVTHQDIPFRFYGQVFQLQRAQAVEPPVHAVWRAPLLALSATLQCGMRWLPNPPLFRHVF